MDDEESGSLRYVMCDAWLRSIIADSWALARDQAEEHPGFVESEGLLRIWDAIAANALAYEVVH